MFYVSCFMQLNMSYITKKCWIQLVFNLNDIYNWMKQIAKDNFSTNEILFT